MKIDICEGPSKFEGRQEAKGDRSVVSIRSFVLSIALSYNET